VDKPITLQLRRGGAVVEAEEVSNKLAYGLQVDAFAAAIEGKTKFPIPGEEGWQNQEILDAAFRSLKSGKTETVRESSPPQPATSNRTIFSAISAAVLSELGVLRFRPDDAQHTG